MPWKVKYGFEYYDPPTLKMIVPYLKQMCSLCTLAGGAAHFCQRRLFLPVIGKKKERKKKEGSVATLRMTDWLTACNKKRERKSCCCTLSSSWAAVALKKKKEASRTERISDSNSCLQLMFVHSFNFNWRLSKHSSPWLCFLLGWMIAILNTASFPLYDTIAS